MTKQKIINLVAATELNCIYVEQWPNFLILYLIQFTYFKLVGYQKANKNNHLPNKFAEDWLRFLRNTRQVAADAVTPSALRPF